MERDKIQVECYFRGFVGITFLICFILNALTILYNNGNEIDFLAMIISLFIVVLTILYIKKIKNIKTIFF